MVSWIILLIHFLKIWGKNGGTVAEIVNLFFFVNHFFYKCFQLPVYLIAHV